MDQQSVNFQNLMRNIRHISHENYRIVIHKDCFKYKPSFRPECKEVDLLNKDEAVNYFKVVYVRGEHLLDDITEEYITKELLTPLFEIATKSNIDISVLYNVFPQVAEHGISFSGPKSRQHARAVITDHKKWLNLITKFKLASY